MSETVHPLDQLVRELQSLRKGAGLSRDKVEKCEVLMEALRVRRPADWWNFFLESIRAVRPVDEGTALLNAYAIDINPPGTLTRRRNDFGQAIGRHSDTVELRENAAIRSLASVLLLDDAPLRGSIHVWARVEHELIRSYRVFRVPEGQDPMPAITGQSPPPAQSVVTMEFDGVLPSPPMVLFRTPAGEGLTILQLSVWFRTGPVPSCIWCSPGHDYGDFVSARYGRYNLQWMRDDEHRATVTFAEPPANTMFAVFWRFSQPGPTLEQSVGPSVSAPVRVQPPQD